MELLALYNCNLSWNIKLRGILTRHTKTNQSERPAGRSWYWSAVDLISNHSHISAILWHAFWRPGRREKTLGTRLFDAEQAVQISDKYMSMVLSP